MWIQVFERLFKIKLSEDYTQYETFLRFEFMDWIDPYSMRVQNTSWIYRNAHTLGYYEISCVACKKSFVCNYLQNLVEVWTHSWWVWEMRRNKVWLCVGISLGKVWDMYAICFDIFCLRRWKMRFGDVAPTHSMILGFERYVCFGSLPFHLAKRTRDG